MTHANASPAAQHWHELVERRKRQMDEAYDRLGRTSADYWRRRMGRTSLLQQRAPEDDPLVDCLRPHLCPTTTVLDVGAGAGRYTRALAPLVAQVIAVEPDATMAELLQAAVDEEGLTGVQLVRSGWLEAKVEPTDLVLCSHVLYPIADAVTFIRKLDAHASRACYLSLRATSPEPEPLGELWRRFHGEPRALQPGYRDAYALLDELGIRANIRITPGMRSIWSFDDFEHAVEAVREHLILPDTADMAAKLREALEPRLVASDGRLILPHQPAPVAIMWWESGSAGQSAAGREQVRQTAED